MRYILLIICFFSVFFAEASEGDTTLVRTFTFDSLSNRRAVFAFPEAGKKWQRVLMRYTIKCDQGTEADKYPCGEWDYTTFTQIYRKNLAGEEEIFELARFITPYGIRLEIGPEGFTWVQDVTDYALFLQDSVDLEAGNTQELLNLTFIFIEGKPVREVLEITNIWPKGIYSYGKLSDNEELGTQKLLLPKGAKTAMIRSRITGHGHEGPENCCEWAIKEHRISVNEQTKFAGKIRSDCGQNPLFPQGGTWQFDRAGWCPGAFADTHDLEIGEVKAGDSLLIDYEIEPYKLEAEKKGFYVMSHQLFVYDDIEEKTDASLEEILAPSSEDRFGRLNPVCAEAVVSLRNTGKNELESVQFLYGLRGKKKAEFEWVGKLKFGESIRIALPAGELFEDSSQFFEAEIVRLNGKKCRNSCRKMLYSEVPEVVVLPAKVYIKLKTNDLGRASENRYLVSDAIGNVVFERDSFEDDTEHEDLLHLPAGCYKFTFFDRAEDGLIAHWWNRQTAPEMVGKNGRLQITDEIGKILHDFGYDFAEGVSLQFRILPEPEIKSE